AAVGVLAACQPQVVEKIVKETVEVEKVVKETVEVEVEKVVAQTVVIEKAVGTPVEIDFWYTTGLVTDAMVADFQEQFSNIKVNVSELGEAVFGDQKFMTAVAAGKGPSVALQNRHTFMQFSAKGLYMDVTPYFDASGLKLSDFAPVQIEETSWQGKIYGLPRETDVRYLIWNRKHYEEVGLDPDKPPTTWAEMEQYADKLNKKDASGNFERFGFIPYLVGNSWMWLYGFLNKAPAISDDKRTILCDDPRWAEALTWLVKFYDNYIGSFEMANSFSQGVTSAGLGDPFRAEKVSMTAHCDTIINELLRNPDLEWDVAPMPIPPNGEKSSWSCGWSLVIPPSAKYPDAAWELMHWWTATADGWHSLADATKADTARYWEREQIDGEPLFMPQDAVYLPAQKMLEEEYVKTATPTMQKAWALSMDCLAGWTHGCGTEMGVAALEYWVEIDNAVRSALAHKMTPEEAMLECKAKVQEGTDRAWEAIDSQAG
ncbi:MAG: extracellular solute-binding protein, partial [Anaerolineae bacterium]